MITVTEVPWSTHSQALMALRMAIFVREQGIALDDELDPNDAKHRHFLAFDEPPTPVGCGRLTAQGQIGRMAVLQQHRHQGIGAALLHNIVTAAHDAGTDRIFLHAQKDAERFYARHGFIATGENFFEAGISHITMHRTLT
ncbi:MAG: GNAT family N-acetyltransferase [Pseudomonadota bacterium]|nr:GNAT family N-acetyltransferase [Pseudomonadota bacterium]MEC7663465.1 GNAT family N-acetyltransferase [Pseudomonadota bacterium]